MVLFKNRFIFNAVIATSSQKKFITISMYVNLTLHFAFEIVNCFWRSDLQMTKPANVMHSVEKWCKSHDSW